MIQLSHHKMDLDFEESLPSHSDLVAPSRSGTGGYDSQERQSGHVSMRTKSSIFLCAPTVLIHVFILHSSPNLDAQ